MVEKLKTLFKDVNIEKSNLGENIYKVDLPIYQCQTMSPCFTFIIEKKDNYYEVSDYGLTQKILSDNDGFSNEIIEEMKRIAKDFNCFIGDRFTIVSTCEKFEDINVCVSNIIHFNSVLKFKAFGEKLVYLEYL